MQLRVDFNAPVSLPDAPLGTRRVLYAKEGSFAGSGLEGKVLRGGGGLVTDPDEIGPALDRAFASGVPYVVNVVTDPVDVYPRSSNLG